MRTDTLFLLPLIFVSFTSNNVHVLSLIPDPDSDVISYAMNCGSSDVEADSEGRQWEIDTQFLTSSSKSLVAIAKHQDPSLPSKVPYMSARIFTSHSSYKIPVPPYQRLWVRLLFYPSTYNNLNPADAYFDVTANGYTLLHNFGALSTAKALKQPYIIKEYSLTPTRSGSLDITFAPSSKHGSSFAFINGIEVVPMLNIFQRTHLVGSGPSGASVEVGKYSLETIARLNVGGKYIPPTNDSIMSRTWYDDTPYLLGADYGVTSEADKNVTIESTLPKGSGPVDLYRTERSMGPNSNVNRINNLTWVFQVDTNFTYVVRFHFCEVQLSKANQREFDIYLNNQTAQKDADVIAWAGGEGIPVYKDYAIYVRDVNSHDQLWVALHPSVSTKPEYYDTVLNGLEIFKLNDDRKNLAGANPVPPHMPKQTGAHAS